MAIAATDIKWRYSGGVANTDPNACLGGVLSTSASGTIDDAVANDLWDDVSSAEASAGDTEYRGFYIKNEHGTLTYSDARIYISSNTSSPDDTVALGIAVEAVSVTMATIANESTAPTSVTFTTPIDYAGGLALNSTTGLAAAAFRGVWVRRTVTAAAAAYTNDTHTLATQGDTLG